VTHNYVVSRERERFETIIKKADAKQPIRDASKDVMVRLNKQMLLSPEFMEIWNID